MPDLKRISEMENCLNECGGAVRSLREQLGRLNALREKAVKLYAYYGSGDWYEDREGDLPEGFRAGVLSEDAVYDSITELRETAFRLLETGTDILKNWI